MSNYSNAIGMMSQGTKFMYIRLVCGMQVFATLVVLSPISISNLFWFVGDNLPLAGRHQQRHESVIEISDKYTNQLLNSTSEEMQKIIMVLYHDRQCMQF